MAIRSLELIRKSQARRKGLVYGAFPPCRGRQILSSMSTMLASMAVVVVVCGSGRTDKFKCVFAIGRRFVDLVACLLACLLAC